MEEFRSVDFHSLGPFNLPETSTRGNSSGMNAANCPFDDLSVTTQQAQPCGKHSWHVRICP